MMTERKQILSEKKKENHILPFMWMKGEDRETILDELNKIEECGIREICLESRPHPDFCGERWWNDLDLILSEAEKRGMRIWVLDDRKFPTGYANGAFERKYPELAKIYLAERHVDIMGPCRDSATLIENFLVPDGRILAVLACPKPDGETLAVSPDGVLDLTDRIKDGFVFYDLPEGPYRLFVIFTTRKGGGREHYMNLIDSRSVRVLIDEVYEKHFERYQEKFGTVFAGFFSDEPEIGNVPGYPFDCLPGQRDIRLPWSAELEENLKMLWAENFRKNLPALWYEMGRRTGTIRCQFMDCVTGLVEKCFSGQLGKWCEEHHVEYIGHIVEDDNAHTRLGCSIGHYFREMRGRHMAGVDVVHHQIVPGFTEKIHQWIAGDGDGEFFHFGLAKLAASAAYLDEKKKGRALCECFGNYGWAEGVSFMKWLTNHLLVRGINHFTPHAFSMSFPDRDCPPHFYARGNNMQFPAFAALMHYMERSATMLSEGDPVKDAAILYHAESEWTGGKTMFFQKPLRALMEHQMDADVVPDDLFADAKISDGLLCIGARKYPALILPGAERIPVHTAEFIEKNIHSSFPVFAVDYFPEADTLGRRLPEEFYSKVKCVTLQELPGELEKAAGTILSPDCEMNELRSFMVRDGNNLKIMFFNEHIRKRAELNVRVTEGKFEIMKTVDMWNGTSRSFVLRNNTIPLSLEPGEAAFIILEAKAAEEEKEAVQGLPMRKRQTILEGIWQISRCGDGKGNFETVGTAAQGEELPQLTGLTADNTFTGIYRYETEFSLTKKTGEEYVLFLPYAGDSAEITLNGISLGQMAGFPGRKDLTRAVADGTNVLRIDVATTMVWKMRDGASTHLQIFPAGLTEKPAVEVYSVKAVSSKVCKK